MHARLIAERGEITFSRRTQVRTCTEVPDATGLYMTKTACSARRVKGVRKFSISVKKEKESESSYLLFSGFWRKFKKVRDRLRRELQVFSLRTRNCPLLPLSGRESGLADATRAAERRNDLRLLALAVRDGIGNESRDTAVRTDVALLAARQEQMKLSAGIRMILGAGRSCSWRLMLKRLGTGCPDL
eukprot:3393325-Rhodomonas_salina.2